jgi:hypothetical protein
MCPGCQLDVAHRQADRRSAAGPPATDSGALIAASSVAAVLAGAHIKGASLGRDGGQAERGDDEQHQSDSGWMRYAGQGQGRNQAQDRDGRAQPERPSRPPPVPTARARARTWWLRRRARRRGQPAPADPGLPLWLARHQHLHPGHQDFRPGHGGVRGPPPAGRPRTRRCARSPGPLTWPSEPGSEPAPHQSTSPATVSSSSSAVGVLGVAGQRRPAAPAGDGAGGVAAGAPGGARRAGRRGGALLS